MSCIEYIGAAWKLTADKLRSDCERGGAVMSDEACPRDHARGACTTELSTGGRVRHWTYKRQGPAQGGDIESDAEVSAACTAPSVWSASPLPFSGR